MIRFIGLLAIFSSAYAATLQDYTEQALCNNPSIGAQSKATQAACERSWATYGPFLPGVNFEGGGVHEDTKVYEDTYRYAFLEGRWNLYRGGGDWAHMRASERRFSLAKLELSRMRKALTQDVATAFYNLLYLKQAHNLYQKVIDGNDEYMEIAKRKWKSGLTTEVDVLEFDLQKDRYLIDQRYIDEQQFSHKENLAQLISCATCPEDIDVEGSFPEEHTVDLCQAKEQALSCRDDYLQSCLHTAIAKDEACIARSDLLPSIDLIATWGTEPHRRNDRGNGGKVMLNFSVPLFHGGQRWRHWRSAKAHERQSCCTYRDDKNRLITEVATIVNRLDVIARQLHSEQKRKTTLTDYLSMTREEYSRGTKNSPDLAGAAERLLNSSLRVISLRRDYALALADLATATGSYFAG